MNDPEILMDLEASLHRIQQRLARIERLLGWAGRLPNEPRADRKGVEKSSRGEDFPRQEPPAGETQEGVPEAPG